MIGLASPLKVINALSVKAKPMQEPLVFVYPTTGMGQMQATVIPSRRLMTTMACAQSQLCQ